MNIIAALINEWLKNRVYENLLNIRTNKLDDEYRIIKTTDISNPGLFFAGIFQIYEIHDFEINGIYGEYESSKKIVKEEFKKKFNFDLPYDAIMDYNEIKTGFYKIKGQETNESNLMSIDEAKEKFGKLTELTRISRLKFEDGKVRVKFYSLKFINEVNEYWTYLQKEKFIICYHVDRHTEIFCLPKFIENQNHHLRYKSLSEINKEKDENKEISIIEPKSNW